MRPRKNVLLCCANQFKAAEMQMILELRLHVKVHVAYGIGISTAIHEKEFHCAILTHNDTAAIDFLRARGIPTLGIGKGPSYADRCVDGPVMEVLEAVRLMCARKRGPKVAALYCYSCGKKVNRFTGHKCQDAIAEAA